MNSFTALVIADHHRQAVKQGRKLGCRPSAVVTAEVAGTTVVRGAESLRTVLSVLGVAGENLVMPSGMKRHFFMLWTVRTRWHAAETTRPECASKLAHSVASGS